MAVDNIARALAAKAIAGGGAGSSSSGSSSGSSPYLIKSVISSHSL